VQVDDVAGALAESEAAFAHTPGGGTVVYTRLFLAMAYQQLDKHPEAQRWLDSAKRATTQPGSTTRPTTTQQQPIAERWNRRVTLQLLRREAERVLTAKKGEVGHQEPTSRSGTTQNAPTARICGHVEEVRAGARLTSGGSSDSDANDWQVKPSGPVEPAAVTTTMPDTKWPSTSRSTAGETDPGGASWLMPRL
jgi:hypothetical protein